jgi:hypothetical protein
MGRRLAPIESCCDLLLPELLQVLQATPAGRLMKAHDCAGFRLPPLRQ